MLNIMVALMAVLILTSSSPVAEVCADECGVEETPEQVQESDYVFMQGYGSYYDQSPTDDTFIARVNMGDLTPDVLRYAEAYIATRDCHHMGKTAVIWVTDHEPLNAVVFDCASRSGEDGTIDWMTDSNIIFELDYYTAVQLGVYGGGGYEAKVQIFE